MNPCTTCGEPSCNIYCGLCLKDYDACGSTSTATQNSAS
jgi:hypothetical protein